MHKIKAAKQNFYRRHSSNLIYFYKPGLEELRLPNSLAPFSSILPDMNPRSNRKPAIGQRWTLTKHMTSTSYKLEPVTWSRGTGQRLTRFDRCQLIITWCHMSKKYMVNQGSLSFLTYYLEDCRHLVRLHSRHRRRRAYAPTINTASHDNPEKINLWVSFSFLYGYGAPLGGPSGRRSSANKQHGSFEISGFLGRVLHVQ